MRVGLIVACVVGLVAAAGAQASGQAARQGGGDASAAIQQVADAYVKATLAGDAKAIAALYTEDAVEMPPNQPSIKGRAAIQKYYEGQFAGGMKMTSFSVTHVETRAAGDAGYDVGTYQQNMSQPSPAPPMADSGKYVVILKQQAGAWKVAYAIYSSDKPTPPR